MFPYYKYFNLIFNMGWRYVAFRSFYLIKTKFGILKKQFPENPRHIAFLTLNQWRNNKNPKFFYQSKEEIKKISNPVAKTQLETIKEEMQDGKFLFFSSVWYNLGKNYNWITNPDTGFQYNISKHWSEIDDFSKEAGDIKYVWEKARFGFLYDIIRYDLHSGNDQSEWVFREIEDFIDHNPINRGPNYKCSQEISLRILNWTFALHYYKNSKNLTDKLFNKILNSIYWQYHHVYHNINFSRIAVRNNHAITETLTLYLIGLLYPFFPHADKWKKQGEKWFEQEISYQIYEDGGFLQFSHNYHRVVVQLLTWAIRLAELNNEQFADIVYSRAKKSLNLLVSIQEENTGWLPNYGMNDGALFFKLNNENYRNFKPQLQALGLLLGKSLYRELYEDAYWYGINSKWKSNDQQTLHKKGINSYKSAGLYLVRDDNTKTIINAVNYNDRPAQADALHLEIWKGEKNIFFDPGTFKYNTEKKYLDFYHGTKGHNTLTIGGHNQMLKGDRFIWYFWTKVLFVLLKETESTYEFEAKIKAFPELGPNLWHQRKVIKHKGINRWKIIDTTNYVGNLDIEQRWNISPEFTDIVYIQAFDKEKKEIPPTFSTGWYSVLYGQKTSFQQKIFSLRGNYLKTVIELI